jgi:hypothetical protein
MVTGREDGSNGICQELSHEKVRQVLEENELKPWLRKEWCIPPKENAQYVYHMEDVLEIYQRSSNTIDRKRNYIVQHRQGGIKQR